MFYHVAIYVNVPHPLSNAKTKHNVLSDKTFSLGTIYRALQSKHGKQTKLTWQITNKIKLLQCHRDIGVHQLTCQMDWD